MSNPSNKLTDPNPPSSSDILSAIEDTRVIPQVEKVEAIFTLQELDQEIKKAHLRTLQDNNIQRRRYAVNTFILTCSWIGVVICIVVLAGIKLLSLSDTVLVTLITTTTASVFGFFLLVMKYLFNPEFEKPKETTGIIG